MNNGITIPWRWLISGLSLLALALISTSSEAKRDDSPVLFSSPLTTRLLIAVPSPTYSIDHTVFANSELQVRAWSSRTGGTQWNPIFSYEDPYSESSSLHVAPAVLGHSDPTVYLLYGIGVDPMDYRLIRSLDGGKTWQNRTLLCGGFGGPCAKLETTNDPNVIFQPGIHIPPYFTSDLGIKRSVNGGLSWRFVWDEAGVGQVTASPTFSQDQTVFAIPQLDSVPHPVPRLIASFDGGDTWQGRDQGLCDRPVDSVALSPTFDRDQIVLVSQGNSILKSPDGGATWQVVFSFESSCREAEVNPMRLFLSPDYASDSIVYMNWDGLFVSYDDARTWQRLTRGYYDHVYVRHRPADSSSTRASDAAVGVKFEPKMSPTIHTNEPRRIYLPAIRARGPQPMPLSVFISGGEAMWRSDDGGVTWTPLASPPDRFAYLPFVRAHRWQRKAADQVNLRR